MIPEFDDEAEDIKTVRVLRKRIEPSEEATPAKQLLEPFFEQLNICQACGTVWN